MITKYTEKIQNDSVLKCPAQSSNKWAFSASANVPSSNVKLKETTTNLQRSNMNRIRQT